MVGVVTVPPVSASAQTIGTWTQTTGYPFAVFTQGHCVSNAAYIDCIGGQNSTLETSSVYYAHLATTGGILSGGWHSTTSYPTEIENQNCVASSGYVYCIGGTNASNAAPSDQVYFAKLSPTGGIEGSWQRTTSYPTGIEWQSCVVYAKYIYCVGGDYYSAGTRIISASVYYARLSSTGVSKWQSTTSYPTGVLEQSCITNTAYVYCIGGGTNSVYFAKLSRTGGIMGGWQSTTNYPTSIYLQSCLTNAGYAYCIGGDNAAISPQVTNSVYYAKLSRTGGIAGSWAQTTSYPTVIDVQSCLAYAGYSYWYVFRSPLTPFLGRWPRNI